jgi:hypothetical protein
MVVEPFGVARNAFKGESQAFGDGAAAAVFNGATNGQAVEIDGSESMLNDRTATGGHDAFALVMSRQPILQIGGLVGPIYGRAIDHPAQFGLLPDTDINPLIQSEFLEANSHVIGDIDVGPAQVHPIHPGAQMHPIGFDQLKKFLCVSVLHQRQFRLFSYTCPKHISPLYLSAQGGWVIDVAFVEINVILSQIGRVDQRLARALIQVDMQIKCAGGCDST